MMFGVALGGLAVVVAPFVARATAPAVRPLLKALLTQVMMAAELGAETFSRLGEGLEDLLAEARADVERELGARGAAPRRAAREEPARPDGPNARGRA